MELTDERAQRECERLLDSREAAAALGISWHTFSRYAAMGLIPSIKLGRARNAHRFFEPHVIEVARQGGIAALDALRNGNGNGGGAE
jgi:hypothetical protein